MTTITKYKAAKGLLLFWCIFIAVGAVGGAIMFWCDSHGQMMNMAAMLPYFQVLPFADFFFQDFIWCGIALLCVNGLTNIAASILLIRNNRWGLILGTLFGITLMLWIALQFYIFPANMMDTLYFIFGILQTLTGLLALHFYQET